MRTRTASALGLGLVVVAIAAAIVFVPTGRSFDETPLLVGFLLYAIGPLGLVIVTSALCELAGVSRPWRYAAMIGAYPLGVFLTTVVLFNLHRLSH
jgi:hypothetical protein